MTLSVSYMWMRDHWSKPHTIPTHLFCRMQENARRYPDMPFDLWTESPQAVEPYAVPPNVAVHDLRSIPAFSKVPKLAIDDMAKMIWAKTDIARLIVMQHELNNMGRGITVYSDMDVADVSIKSDGFKQRIKDHGIVVGGIVDPYPDGPIRSRAENGYFAFAKERAGFLDTLVSAVAQNVNNTFTAEMHRSYVFDLTTRFFDCQERQGAFTFPERKPHLQWREEIGCFGVLPPGYYKGDKHLLAEPSRPMSATQVPVALIPAAEFTPAVS